MTDKQVIEYRNKISNKKYMDMAINKIAEMEKLSKDIAVNQEMTVQELNYIFGCNIKTLRKKKKLTQQKLADKLGVNQLTINDWENGHKFAQPLNLVSLASLLGVKVYELFK